MENAEIRVEPICCFTAFAFKTDQDNYYKDFYEIKIKGAADYVKAWRRPSSKRCVSRKNG